ncbi:MAG: hypothetical protein EOO02_10720, partial [Chitinophagaceae bacterium]
MKPFHLIFVTFLLLTGFAHAQSGPEKLEIKFNKSVFSPGDSLLMTASYNDAGSDLKDQSVATLELIIENESGSRTRLRWPVIKGRASGSIFLPDALPLGKYTVYAGLQQRFYEVTGKVKNAKNTGILKAMLLTKDGGWDEQEVTVSPDGSFAIRNWLFEDNALLAFASARGKDQSLNIAINSELDSSFEPLAVAAKVFYVGNPPDAVRPTLNNPVDAPQNLF